MPRLGLHGGGLGPDHQDRTSARQATRRALLMSLGLVCTASMSRDTQTAEAGRLALLINRYRSERGLPVIPISRSLTLVAETHLRDLETNKRPSGCNMHSWSGQGRWSACCYTPDHARAQCMWSKPEETTAQIYRGEGFEISFGADSGVTPAAALGSWKASQAHHDVIINRGAWASFKWRAMGVAISDRYALAWFGEQEDPAGKP